MLVIVFWQIQLIKNTFIKSNFFYNQQIKFNVLLKIFALYLLIIKVHKIKLYCLSVIETILEIRSFINLIQAFILNVRCFLFHSQI